MKKFKQALKYGALVPLAVAGAAHAALPEGASAAIAQVGTDVVSAIGLVIAVGIAIYGAKKVGQKMGWL